MDCKWIDDDIDDDTSTIARDTIINSRRYFAHEMMNKQMEMVTQEDDTKESNVDDYTYSYPEELQIVIRKQRRVFGMVYNN